MFYSDFRGYVLQSTVLKFSEQLAVFYITVWKRKIEAT